jgi:hypothetical protein
MSIDDSEFQGAFEDDSGQGSGGRTGRPDLGQGDPEPAEFERQVPETGDPGLDETLRELARASAIPLEDQLPVIEAVHRSLQDRLADVEG